MSSKSIFKNTEGFIEWITSIDTNVLQELLNKFNSLSEHIEAIPDMKEFLEKINSVSETTKNYITNETSEIKGSITESINSFKDNLDEFKNSLIRIKEAVEKKLKIVKILLYVTLSASLLSLIFSIIVLFI